MTVLHLLAAGVSRIDWTTNIAVDVMLVVLIVFVFFWRKKAFEAAVDAACDGKGVSLRGAYNQFLVWMTITAVSCLGAAIASTFIFVEQFQ